MPTHQRKRPIKKHPLLPAGVEILVPPPPYEACTLIDKLLVYASSLIVVGSPFWFYGGIIYLYKRWRHYRMLASQYEQSNDECTNKRQATKEETTEQYTKYKRLAKRFATAITTILLLSILGPHRHPAVGKILNIRSWRLWDAWLNYIGYTVLHDHGNDTKSFSTHTKSSADSAANSFDMRSSPAIYTFIPHGIFPFGLAFSCLPSNAYTNTWGLFHPVVATATKLFPLVRTLISWMGGVDASRSAVSHACRGGGRIGISPGGIGEMFETFPKPGFHKNDEAALLKDRKGMFALAMKHRLPIVPVYVFGVTKMFRRVQLPAFLETASRVLRISLCLFFGRWGLPVPYRQRLMYVVGRTIFPMLGDGEEYDLLDGGERERRVERMHDAFCEEIERIFDRNKGHYGWGHKMLRIV